MESIQHWVSIIQQNVPNVYETIKGRLNSKDNKYCKYFLNCSTGEIYPYKIKENKNATSNVIIPTNTPGYDLKGFDNAFIIGEHIVVARWVLMNPESGFCTDYSTHLSRNEPISSLPHDVTYNGPAICKIILPPPQLLAFLIIDKDKRITSWTNSNFIPKIYHAEKYSLYNKSTTANLMNSIFGYKSAFRKFFKYGFISNNNYSVFDEYKDIAKFLRTPDLIPLKNKAQNVINMLVQHPLPDHNIHLPYKTKTCFVERVNDEFIAMRFMISTIDNTLTEVIRLYINKEKQYCCRINRKGQWTVYNGKLKAASFVTSNMVLENDNVFDNTKLEYFKTIYPSLQNPCAALYMLSTYPEFEKLYKLGLTSICEKYIEQSQKSMYPPTWREYIRWTMGPTCFNEKNIYCAIGLNAYQTQRVQQVKNCDRIIWYLKESFDMPKLNDIDNAQFDEILNFLLDNNDIISLVSRCIASTKRLYPKTYLSYVRNLMSIPLHQNIMFPFSNHRFGLAVSVYRDVMDMIEIMECQDSIKPHFTNAEQLLIIHDSLIDLLNNNQEDRLKHSEQKAAVLFEKRRAFWEQWLFEDEKYIIIAPNSPTDMVIEGITLCHCVRSYIQNVANGITNILFIREKKDIKKPFFTIQIENDGTIKQIHGSHNRNVSTEPGLQDFINLWGKNKKLKNYDHPDAILAPRRNIN